MSSDDDDAALLLFNNNNNCSANLFNGRGVLGGNLVLKSLFGDFLIIKYSYSEKFLLCRSQDGFLRQKIERFFWIDFSGEECCPTTAFSGKRCRSILSNQVIS